MGRKKYNEGKLVGEWVKFPTTTEDMEKVFERIGIGSKAAYEYESFEAILQVSDYTGSLKDLINLTDNLDKYEVYPFIENEEDPGRYYAEEMIGTKIPDSIKDYFDYEAYGRDMSINEGGVFLTVQ